ncbi:MOSC domain-containing protein, partial [Klebsiella pneumoniae]|uniref:MOSC domain-containing protein n=1 Tax=Klebsiella pneumoniae TaxID=573 RepID=UPI0022EABBBF
AWDEDSWKVIRIGEVVFDVAKPCSRCIFTTVSPERGQKHPAGASLVQIYSGFIFKGPPLIKEIVTHI